MSALGQKQTYAAQKAMSALPPKADMCSAQAHVCFGPQTVRGLLIWWERQLHDPLPFDMGNENSSRPSSSCTRMDHFDHSSSKNVLVSNFNSCATTWAWARAASISASSVPSTS